MEHHFDYDFLIINNQICVILFYTHCTAWDPVEVCMHTAHLSANAVYLALFWSSRYSISVLEWYAVSIPQIKLPVWPHLSPSENTNKNEKRSSGACDNGATASGVERGDAPGGPLLEWQEMEGDFQWNTRRIWLHGEGWGPGVRGICCRVISYCARLPWFRPIQEDGWGEG